MIDATRAQILDELAKRGVSTGELDVSEQPMPGAAPPSLGPSMARTSNIPAKVAIVELKRRGMSDAQIAKSIGQGPVEPSLMELVQRDFPELAGAMIGGLAGPPGLLGGIAAAGTGAAVGKGIELLTTGDRSATLADSASQMGGAALRQGAGEGAGRAAMSIVGKVLQPFAGTVSQRGREFSKYMQSVVPGNGKAAPLLPNQVADSALLDYLQTYTEGSIFGSAFFKASRDQQKGMLRQATDDLARGVGRSLTDDDLGRLIGLTLEGKFNAAEALADPVWNAVREGAAAKIQKVKVPVYTSSPLMDPSGKQIQHVGEKLVEKEVGGVRVDLRPVRELARKLQESSDRAGLKSADFGDDVITQLTKGSDFESYEIADLLRSRLNNKIRTLRAADKSNVGIRNLSALQETTFNQVEKALGEQAPDLLPTWEEARSLTRKAKEMQTDFLSGLVQQLDIRGGGKPEAIVQALFKPNNVSNIRQARESLPADVWGDLQARYIDDVFTKSGTADGGFDGRKMLELLNTRKGGGVGPDSVNEIFRANPDARQNVEAVARAWQQVQGKSSRSNSVVSFSQHGAMITLAASMAGLTPASPYGEALTGTAGALIITPAILAKLMTSKAGSHWLTEGIKTPAWSGKAAGVTSKLIGEAIRLKSEENDRQADYSMGDASVQVVPREPVMRLPTPGR